MDIIVGLVCAWNCNRLYAILSNWINILEEYKPSLGISQYFYYFYVRRIKMTVAWG